MDSCESREHDRGSLATMVDEAIAMLDSLKKT